MKNKIYKRIFLFLFSISMASPFLASSQQVIIGTSTAASIYSPLGRSLDYGVCDLLYTAAEINHTGAISQVGFQRVGGSDITAIDNVTIYMKHTTVTSLISSSFTTTGFTQVFSGSFTNNITNGWNEVLLNNPFMYNGTDNLEVLVVKGYQAALSSGEPLWSYTDLVSVERMRRYTGNSPITSSTALASNSYRSNIMLDFGPVGIFESKTIDFSFFPNPSNGKITFMINNNERYENLLLNIYNVFGKSVYQNKVIHGEEINLDALAKGIYFYEIRTGESKMLKSGKLMIAE